MDMAMAASSSSEEEALLMVVLKVWVLYLLPPMAKQQPAQEIHLHDAIRNSCCQAGCSAVWRHHFLCCSSNSTLSHKTCLPHRGLQCCHATHQAPAAGC